MLSSTSTEFAAKLPCGCGKSIIIAAFSKISLLHSKSVLIAVPSIILCKQMMLTLDYFDLSYTTFFTDNENVYHQNSISSTLVLSCYQSLTKVLNVYNSFTYIIIDEAHHYEKEAYLNYIINQFNFIRLFKFSATINSPDFEYTLSEAINSNIVCNFKLELNVVSEKNAQAILDIITHHPEYTHILIYCNKISTCQLINSYLSKFSSITSSVITAKTSQSLRTKILSDKSIRVVLNCKCISEGVDVNYFDTSIFYDDTSDPVRVIQSLGRLVRKDPSNPTKIAKFVILSTNPTEQAQLEKLNYYLSLIRLDQFDFKISITSKSLLTKPTYQLYPPVTEEEFNQYFYTRTLSSNLQQTLKSCEEEREQIKNIKKRKFISLHTRPMALTGKMFNNNTFITTFVIPFGTQSIGPQYFLNCSNLKFVNIPPTVTTIDSTAFRGCTSLQTSVKSQILKINPKCKF